MRTLSAFAVLKSSLREEIFDHKTATVNFGPRIDILFFTE